MAPHVCGILSLLWVYCVFFGIKSIIEFILHVLLHVLIRFLATVKGNYYCNKFCYVFWKMCCAVFRPLYEEIWFACPSIIFLFSAIRSLNVVFNVHLYKVAKTVLFVEPRWLSGIARRAQYIAIYCHDILVVWVRFRTRNNKKKCLCKFTDLFVLGCLLFRRIDCTLWTSYVK